ncbi:glutathione synthase [Parvularcula sp. IMCC14364]|uniref:glutathione synthase n=1 Tax=Parvularcula sp. IMCC14364 TaxID=3067902 RepID=UPI00274185E2|nr:glutathione synthase [Parvularcula sp. IMCC14364]
MPALKIAIQMDPMEAVDINADTTFDLALEAFSRGHSIWIYQPETLRLENGRVAARTTKVATFGRTAGGHVSWADEEDVSLHDMDVLLVRQDPPFDMGYITACHILEHLMQDVLVLNNPKEIRNAPEKLFVTEFPDLHPPTLITSDEPALRRFREEHEDIILKPLYGNGGAGVFRVRPDDQNFSSLLEMFSQFYREPVIAQAYLKDVRAGDKRIILIDGKPVGAINRIPSADEVRSNMHVGGVATAVDISARDREICERIGPALSERGLIFVGIDVIGDWLTEINVTSPTGIQEVRKFGGADISILFWDWVEAQ